MSFYKIEFKSPKILTFSEKDALALHSAITYSHYFQIHWNDKLLCLLQENS